MKLHFLHKKLSSNIRFSLHQEREFLKLWHHHPEIELVYILKGEGTLYAGDFIGGYQENDIFLLGKNVPHMFHSNPIAESEPLSKSYVFHINELLLNNDFKDLPEFYFLKHIREISKRGVMFRQGENRRLLDILGNLENNSPSENTIKVFQLLLHLSEYEEYTSLGSINWLEHFKISDMRINNVIEHVMLNFKEDIPLKQIGEISGMNKSAFCRYFKKNTGKSFVNFLNEIRINHSCKVLQEKRPLKTISEACYQSGFNSLSYYNRTFKKVMGLSPSEYKASKNLS